MNIDSLKVVDNPNAKKDKKRLIAIFTFNNNDKIKKIKFGYYGSKGTFADGASTQKRDNYIKRHKKRENWENILTAGALSRYILWQGRTNTGIQDFIKNKFKINNVTVNFKRY